MANPYSVVEIVKIVEVIATKSFKISFAYNIRFDK